MKTGRSAHPLTDAGCRQITDDMPPARFPHSVTNKPIRFPIDESHERAVCAYLAQPLSSL